jgi:CDP-2,3-bis-(O-geranylgeranyl)-sn-glycerol synthase
MINEIIFVWWFFSPAGVSNVGAFLAGKIPMLKKYSYPADFGIKFRGKRLLGSNKTLRGFIFGILASIVIVYLQIFLYENFQSVREMIRLDYSSINPVLFGALSGFGALFGDSIKSFFKRQVGVPPGHSWVPFDQIDYILGGMLFTSFYIQLTTSEYLLLFVMFFILHPLTTLLGYLLKLKKSPL